MAIPSAENSLAGGIAIDSWRLKLLYPELKEGSRRGLIPIKRLTFVMFLYFIW
jgi:hypothetical protein